MNESQFVTGMKERLKSMVASKKGKKYESVFEVNTEKPTHLALSADSASMGFAAFLKPEFQIDGMNLEAAQRADLFMNSFIVHLVQITLIVCIWKYAGIFGEVATFVDGHEVKAPPFRVTRPDGLDMTIARFMASMMMHINVERDV